jgi:integrase
MSSSSPFLPTLVDLYLHGDPPNGWRGKFAKHAPDPCGHSEAINVRCALKLLVDTVIEVAPNDDRATRRGERVASRHLADLQANQLRPSDLRNVQQRLVDRGRARSYINASIRRMLKFFAWCVKYEHMESAVLCGLQTIDPLGEGEDGVREPAAIVSPASDVLAASLACASWLLRQAMLFQALCAMRPGELVQMRVCDLRLGRRDERGVTWEYRPQRHKTAHKGVRRIVQVIPQTRRCRTPRRSTSCSSRPNPCRSWALAAGWFQCWAVRRARRRVRLPPVAWPTMSQLTCCGC